MKGRGAKIFLVMTLAISLLAACKKKKDDKTSTTPTTTPTTTSTYYFRFTLNGLTDTINGDDTKAYTENTNAVLASITQKSSTLDKSLDLRFSLPVNADTIVESQILGLAGKTLYFTDTIMKPEISYQKDGTNDWFSDWTADNSYNVKVTSVDFLKTDTYQGYPVRLYVVSGSTRALMRQAWDTSYTMTGSFKMILSWVNYK